MYELVSVIITTYKRPIEVLLRAIKSVLRQSYSNYELLIVNDNPEDLEGQAQIINIIKDLNDKRIKYLTYESNQGSNYARNYGLYNSKGAYVAFLDDDDEWFPSKLEMQVNIMKENPQVGLVSCGFFISDGNKVIGEKKPEPLYDYSIDNLIVYNYIAGTSFPLLRKSVIDEVGGFDTQMVSCQEYELWLRMREVCEFATVKNPLGVYYVSDDSVFRNNIKKYYAGDQRLIEKNIDLLKWN